MLEPHEFHQAQRWLPCKNTGGTAILAFSTCKVTDVYDDGTLQVEYVTLASLTKPVYVTDNFSYGTIFFNGPITMAAGQYGFVTRDYPVRYNDGSVSPFNGYTFLVEEE